MSGRHQWSHLRNQVPAEHRAEADTATQRMLEVIDAIAEIKRRPYHWQFVPEEGGTWFGRIVEFPGCITSGANDAADAFAMLDDAMTAWLHSMLQDGDPIPEPIPE